MRTGPRRRHRAKRVRVGTIGALAIACFNSPVFLGLAATQATYRLILEASLREHGDKAARDAHPQAPRRDVGQRVGDTGSRKSLAAADQGPDELGGDEQAAAPTIRPRGMDYIKRNVAGFHTWNEPEIAPFEAHHPIGSKARLALALLLYTAHGVATWSAWAASTFVTASCTFASRRPVSMLAIPVHPALQAILDATPSGT